MEQNFDKTAEQTAAFQKMWLESISKIMQAAFTFSPNSPPPEVMRQIRTGIFAALGESWDQFMRSPEFLESMRQWMDQAVAFRKMSNEFMGRIRNELQSPSRDDIDTIMLAVRHMERRLLDRMDELAARMDDMNGRVRRVESTRGAAETAGRNHRKRSPKRAGDGQPLKP